MHVNEPIKFELLDADAETYSEPSRTNKMELFQKLFNGFQTLTIFIKISYLRCLTEFGTRHCVYFSELPFTVTKKLAFAFFLIKICGKILASRYLKKVAFISRGGSRTAATSKMEHLVIIVNSWKPLISD